MKTIGIMCVKDEADLLPQVYPHIRGLVDYLYVYEDGSTDNTWDIVKDSDYAIRKVDDKDRLTIPRPNYHHLLERIKNDFHNEHVWCFITMGDRMFFNKTPQEIIQDAGNNDAVEGLQVDCIKDDWTIENDPWPDYSNITALCKRHEVSEHCVIAYKLTTQVSYLQARYPWPHKLGSIQYKDEFNLNKPRLLHYGRRSPKGHMWRYSSGSRPMSVKYKDKWDLSTVESTIRTVKFFNGSKYGLQNLELKRDIP